MLRNEKYFFQPLKTSAVLCKVQKNLNYNYTEPKWSDE